MVGLGLSIGMLLDNSVVVLENIYRLSGKRFDPDIAVTQGTTEVWRSIVASTLTTITVFFPFLFSSEYMIKLLGNHVGISIISTLTVSLFVALLLIPVLAHLLLKGKSSHNIFYEKVTTNNRVIQIYVLLLKSSMRAPAATTVGAVVLFFITIFIVLAINVNTLDEVEETRFSIYVTMRTGSTLEATDLVVAEIESRLEEIEEREDVISNIQAEEAIITVILQEDYKKINDRTIAEIKSQAEGLIQNIARAEVSLTASASSSRFRGSSGGASGIENFSRFLGIGTNRERIVIKGEDFDIMRGVAEDLRYYVENLESIRSVSLSIGSRRPELHLYFNQFLLTEYGLTLNSISSELGSFSREFSTGINFKQGNEEYGILIKEKLTEEEEKREKDVNALRRVQLNN